MVLMPLVGNLTFSSFVSQHLKQVIGQFHDFHFCILNFLILTLLGLAHS